MHDFYLVIKMSAGDGSNPGLGDRGPRSVVALDMDSLCYFLCVSFSS